MLKKKIERAQEIAEAKEYIKTLPLNSLATPDQRLMAKAKYPKGSKFTNVAWGIICTNVTGGKKKATRKKRRIKGRKAKPQAVTAKQSKIVVNKTTAYVSARRELMNVMQDATDSLRESIEREERDNARLASFADALQELVS